MSAKAADRTAEHTVYRDAGSRTLPPRERILRAARCLFARDGIHGVGVEAIAEAAGTNKMTLYRHFESKELLVAEYIRGLVAESDTLWQEIDAEHPGCALAQLHGWIDRIAGHADGGKESGCALAYAAVQLTDSRHPGRQVIDANKRDHRAKLIHLCRASELSDPELVADQLFAIVEGVRVMYQDSGVDRPLDLKTLVSSLIASHQRAG